MIDYKQKMIDLMEKQGASDLHIAVGRHPVLRINGSLIPLVKEPVLTPEMTENLIKTILTDQQKEDILRYKDIDFSYSLGDLARFRVAVYFQRQYWAASLRLIPRKIRTIEELNLPPVIHNFAKYSQGFVLVVGPAGHGKSTTLAAILDEINHDR